MTVLLVSPAFLVPWMRYTTAALRRLGHRVVQFTGSNPALDFLTERQGRKFLEKWPIGGPVADEVRRLWLEARDRRLLRLAKISRPDLTLVLRGETIPAATLQEIRRITRKPLVTWWLDNPFRFEVKDRLPLFDQFFVFDRSYIPELKAAGAPSVHFLPCCCDERVYRPLKLTALQTKRFASEVAFVAWYGPGRDRIVKTLEPFDLKVWGRGWNSSEARAALNGASRRIVAPETYVSDRTAARIYNAAQIGLNVHNPQSRLGGVNARAFELLSCGTFQLSDHVEGMEELLEPGKELEVYRSPEEAKEKTSYYLRNPARRREIAQKGRERVLAEHTYLHRVRKLLKITLESR